MQMVLDAANLNRRHIILSSDAPDVFPDALFDAGMNPGMAIFGAEDDVVMKARVGVGHRWLLQQSVATRRHVFWVFRIPALKRRATVGWSLRDKVIVE